MEIIAKYLKYMVEKDASDIYFTVGVPPSFRVEGIVAPHAEHTAAHPGRYGKYRKNNNERKTKEKI